MKTVTIDIINNKALSLLHDLEYLQLIRVRKEKRPRSVGVDWTSKYKGTMTKQETKNIDRQLNELRNAWE